MPDCQCTSATPSAENHDMPYFVLHLSTLTPSCAVTPSLCTAPDAGSVSFPMPIFTPAFPLPLHAGLPMKAASLLPRLFFPLRPHSLSKQGSLCKRRLFSHVCLYPCIPAPNLCRAPNAGSVLGMLARKRKARFASKAAALTSFASKVCLQFGNHVWLQK